ncbi:MAG TPA: DUF3048 C-terminal domain-containing protein, partial [Tepidiformaceae bacterium]|nr:DUF3048 C-terminal domain-containing protein [Tepidiformaceae bacterium]
NPSDAPASGTPAGGIDIDFEGNRYAGQVVQWKWDAATNSYLRFEFGGPHIDARTGQQLHFTNVIVMTAPATVVDSSGHVLIDQIGSGPATVFFDGQAITGTWKKADRTARTRFYDAKGNEIALERGPTFIEVIGLQSTLTVTASAAALPPMPQYVPPPPSAPSEPDDTAPPPPTLPPLETPGSGSSATPSATGTPGGTPGGTSGATSPSPSASTSSTPASSPTPQPSTTTPGTTTTPDPGQTALPESPTAAASASAPSTQPSATAMP